MLQQAAKFFEGDFWHAAGTRMLLDLRHREGQAGCMHVDALGESAVVLHE